MERKPIIDETQQMAWDGFQRLQKIVYGARTEDSVEKMLECLVDLFCCDRAYIYQLQSDGTIDNTYEWCRYGVSEQKEFLQDVPEAVIGWWQEQIGEGQVLLIEDVEQLRIPHPLTYGFLKPQQITSMAATPLYGDGERIGYLGLDNPKSTLYPMIQKVLSMVACLASMLMKQEQLSKKTEEIQFRDPLTGVWNRQALTNLKEGCQSSATGLLLFEVQELKQINRTLGYGVGDGTLVQFTVCLSNILKTQHIYRISGCEFVVILLDTTEEMLQYQVEQLRVELVAQKLCVNIVWVWTEDTSVHWEYLLKQAQEQIGEREAEKDTAYLALPDQKRVNCVSTNKQETDFNRYVKQYYYDAEAIIQSITMSDSTQCVYFGDMRSNYFYISDNMRDTFGFGSNLVYDLLTHWGNRVATPEQFKLYQNDIADMLKYKRTIHDLRYQVKDRSGNVRWIRCFGILRWNEEKTEPVFFSGSVSFQDNSFIVDPITNFPREHTALMVLNTLEKPTDMLIFSLNHFTEINETKGRYNANQLMKQITAQIVQTMGEGVRFYRLDGLKFMGIPQNGMTVENPQNKIEQLRGIVEQGYSSMEISVRNACSFGVMRFPNGVDTAHTFIENAMVLISDAKQKSEKEYIVYSPEGVQKLKEHANLSLALSQNALDGMKQFRIVIQPVVSAQTGRAVGGEVLMRWQYEGRDVSPGLFIPLMEKGKTIHIAGKWVFEQTVRACRQLLVYDPEFYLTFNVSYHQIVNDDFIDFVEKTLEKYQVSGKNLVAELTETHFDEEPEKLRGFVERCSKLHIRIALDDFGNGYSSLGLLLKYPASIVKLDRSLLVEMTGSEDKMNFINSIVYACHRFGKKVCMEGVETDEQNILIKESGCDLIQGFYYHRPMELHAVYELVSSQS